MKIIIERTATPQDALDALVASGFQRGIIDQAGLKSLPIFEATEVDYVFGSLGEVGQVIPSHQVDNVFEARYGCKHTADFVGVCATIANDPTLIDAGPIAMQWLDGDGRYCWAIWSWWGERRWVSIFREDGDWHYYLRLPRPRT